MNVHASVPVYQDQESQKLKHKLVHLSRNLRARENELTSVEQKLENLDGSRREKVQKLKDWQMQLQVTSTLVQRLSRHGPEALTHAASSSESLLRSAIILKSLARSLKDNSQALNQELKKLDSLRANIDNERLQLAKAKKALEEESQKIEKLLERRRVLLKREKEKQEKIQNRVNQLASESGSLHDLIRRLEQGKLKPQLSERYEQVAVKRPMSPPDGGGKYELLPVQGKIISSYGQVHSHNSEGAGVVFQTRAGARVLSPVQGQVVFAGPFRLYHQILIIRHDNGYHTLLAGLDRLDTDVGQTVSSGEPIGIMGSKDARAYLYLELRKGGDPVNPQAWLSL
jgi:septal ring factor EnvC (AmiA/AmiB activator)